LGLNKKRKEIIIITTNQSFKKNNMDTLFPDTLLAYLQVFRQSFSQSSFCYFGKSIDYQKLLLKTLVDEIL